MKKSFLIAALIALLSLFICIRIIGGNAASTTAAHTTTSEATQPVPDASPSSSSSSKVTPITVEKDEVKEAVYQGVLNDPWHGDFTPVAKYSGPRPRIVCWGDSLTESTSRKTSYPDFLRTLSRCEVINYGIHSENTSMIAMREGGIGVKVGATVIPANKDLIPVFLTAENKDPIYFLDYGEAGINPCTIGGIQGNLTQINGSYYFSRSEAGEIKSIDDGTLFETFAMTDVNPSDVLVIFTGTNDMPDSESIYDIIDIQKSMIKYAKCTKYIVIGLTYAEGIKEIDTINEILSNEYEDHFLDIRSYMLSYGLSDADITPTSADEKDIEKGNIPSSLRSDYVHGNREFYELLANQVYRRMQYLGYLPL